MQTSAFFCDCCGRNLDESKDTAPIVSYLTFGLTPMAQARHPEGFDFAGVAMPAPVRTLLNKPLPRLDLCLDCLPAVLQHVGAKQPVTADGTRRALASGKAKAINEFLADELTSVRPEHPNRVIREQQRKAEAERAAQQAPAETPAQRAARLRAELAATEAELAKTEQAATKRTRRAAKAAAGGDS